MYTAIVTISKPDLCFLVSNGKWKTEVYNFSDQSEGSDLVGTFYPLENAGHVDQLLSEFRNLCQHLNCLDKNKDLMKKFTQLNGN